MIPGTLLTPDRNLNGSAGQKVAAVHTLTNTGNADDSYDFSSVAAGDFTPIITYYEDADGSGSLTPGDVLLTDTDGDGNPNTGDIAPAASVTILVVYDLPAGAGAGDTATITTTAASDFQPLETDVVTDVITIVLEPLLVISKNVATASDPVNNTNNPKAIPGSEVLYTVTVTNTGPGAVDDDTFEITDAVPNDSCMIVRDIAGPGSGPVQFQDGTPASGLTYTFIGLGSAADDLEFSNDGGLTYSYTPVPDARGCDVAITHIRIRPGGTFAADLGGGSPEARFSFRTAVN